MSKKLIFTVSLLFFAFFPICVFVFEIVFPSPGLSIWQGFFTFVATILIATVLFSLAVQFIVVLPLEDFRENMEETWKKKQAIFTSRHLPKELYDIDQTFLSIVGEIENKTKTLQKIGQLDELKSEFITIASHQLRTPLTEIKWAVETLSESPKTKSDNNLQKLVGKAREAVGRTNAIVAQLLSVTEMSLDQATKRTSPVDLEKIVRLAVKENETLATGRGIVIAVQKDTGFIPTIIGDADLLRFIFLNLIGNAISYGFLGKPVTIRMQGRGKTVDISVENDGTSIKPSERSMLFEKFWRGAEAKQMHPDGSGLALYLTKKIVERYGGTVTYTVPVENKNIFSVRLPVDASGEVQMFITKY